MTRYFGKNFIQNPENVDIGVSRSATITHGPGGRAYNLLSVSDFIIWIFNSKLIIVLTAKMLSRAGRTLHDVQTHLDREGASDLVVELMIKSVHSPSIFVEVVELGIALLEGGNPIIQRSIFNKLMGADLSQLFFKVR